MKTRLTNLINKDDAGLQFDSEGKDGRREFLRLSVPFISQCGRLQVDEVAAGRSGRRLGDQCFPTSGRSV